MRFDGVTASGAVADVLVTEAIKGVFVGQEIRIAQGATSCSVRFRVDAEGYVASYRTVEINGEATPLIDH